METMKQAAQEASGSVTSTEWNLKIAQYEYV